MTGVALLTNRETEACAGVYFEGSVGENVAVSVCVPAGSTFPAAGLYANLPETGEVAFS